jgi:hypothetical protein
MPSLGASGRTFKELNRFNRQFLRHQRRKERNLAAPIMRKTRMEATKAKRTSPPAKMEAPKPIRFQL